MIGAEGKTRSEEFDSSDREFMKRALRLAQKAEAAGEIPVGALLVHQGQILGEGWNAPIGRSDPTCHAEVEALRAAAKRIGNYRLSGTTLYCSLEPCVMCVGAISIARVERLVFAARDLRFGAVRSKFALADTPLINHRVIVEEGLLAAEAGAMLAEFFQRSRKAKKTPPDAVDVALSGGT